MPTPYHRALVAHKDAACKAYTLYKRMCEDRPPPRVPGMDTHMRLAWRIQCGRSVPEAAAREYLYRWRLAIGRAEDTSCPWLVFGAPHLLGI